MFRRIIWVCLPFACAHPVLALSLLTYNVSGNGATNWTTSAPQVQAIGREVMYLQPDVITFNEIPTSYWYEMTNFVQAYLPGYYLATNSIGDGFIQSAIASRYPITRSTNYLHGSRLDAYGYNGTFTRDLFEAEIAVPGYSLPYHAFTTHLKAMGDSSQRRSAEAGAISNFFYAGFLTTNAAHLYTLSGDFNEDILLPSNPTYYPIQRLTNSITGLKLTTPTNRYSGQDFTISIRGTLDARFDYILPCAAFYTNIVSSQVFRTDLQPRLPPPLLATDSATASDHLPVMMVFNRPADIPPLITSGPRAQTVLAGQGAAFTVVATGTPPLAYQWRFNGVGIPGATNSSITFSPAQDTNFGFYSVVVTNIAASRVSSNALLAVLSLGGWGDNSCGQTRSLPWMTNTIAVAAGAWHSLALRPDGTVLAWGDNSLGQCNVPGWLTDAVAVAAGGYHSLAIRANGSVVAWGANTDGQTNIPAAALSRVMAISAGTWHSLALRTDGTVVAWGDNSWGQTSVPPGLANVVAIAAGGNHNLALRTDGTIIAWGENTDADGFFIGQSVVPWTLRSAAGIGAGEYHSLVLQTDGTVVAWGDDSEGQCDVPPGLTNVVAVAGGGTHSLALKADGTVAAWGANWSHQCELTAGLSNVVGLGAGELHTLALVAGSQPVPQLLTPLWQGSRFSVLAQTLYRRNYVLEGADSLGTGWRILSTNAGNGALKLLCDPAATNAHRFYRMSEW